LVPAIISQVNAGDPAAWDHLGMITAPTLLIGGGPQSHIPQDRLAAVADRIPSCELITIAAGTTCTSPGRRSSPTPCPNGSPG
jgi:pimeloyl-ACP methyl ester carboxylesterase